MFYHVACYNVSKAPNLGHMMTPESRSFAKEDREVWLKALKRSRLDLHAQILQRVPCKSFSEQADAAVTLCSLHQSVCLLHLFVITFNLHWPFF